TVPSASHDVWLPCFLNPDGSSLVASSVRTAYFWSSDAASSLSESVPYSSDSSLLVSILEDMYLLRNEDGDSAIALVSLSERPGDSMGCEKNSEAKETTDSEPAQQAPPHAKNFKGFSRWWMAYNGGGIWWYKGLVVVGFGVDGVTDVDELVGGGGRWCRGGVGREWMRCGDAMRCVEKKDEYPSSTYHLLINVIEIEPSCLLVIVQDTFLDLWWASRYPAIRNINQAFGTDALLHINNRSMTTKTLGEEYSDITQVSGSCGLPSTPARRALFIV
ncbi:hypothetical protein Tco_0729338, partial [Tanacetum coccineum]